MSGPGELHSLQGFAWILGIPLDELLALAADVERYYRPFELKRPGKRPRPIDQPIGVLKEVQRRARAHFLAGQPLDEGVRACVKGGSAYKNADVHRNQKYFAKFDIKNCYPNVNNTMTYRNLRSIGLGPKPASLLTRLSTRFRHIPQGAPTSDMIANLVLRQVDQRVREIAEAFHLERGRCMDDIALSGDAGTHEAMGLVIAAIRESGFAVPHKKTKHAGPSVAHVATGYTVNGPWGPKVVRSKVQEIRTQVYRVTCASRRGEPIEQYLPSVRGSLAYLRRTNPGVVRRLERQLQAAGISLKAPRPSR